MKSQLKYSLAAILTLVIHQASASAGVIFDNTTTPLSAASFTVLQEGDEVAVSGTALNVNDLKIGVTSQGSPGSATLQAFLYANDGAAGAPGTLLWTSAIMPNVALTGGSDLIDFAVPNVLVPSTFTWAIQISDTRPIASGLPIFSPPTVGGILHGWFGGPGSWTSLDGMGADADYMARISASSVPEPTALVHGSLALLIGLGFSCRRWRRNRPSAR
jgi:hypothetical protein